MIARATGDDRNCFDLIELFCSIPPETFIQHFTLVNTAFESFGQRAWLSEYLLEHEMPIPGFFSGIRRKPRDRLGTLNDIAGKVINDYPLAGNVGNVSVFQENESLRHR